MHDEELFKEHPPTDDCPICFLPLPLDAGERTFETCCGKLICSGCIYAMEEARERGKESLCAFCREPKPTSDQEEVERVKKLMEANNANAICLFAIYSSSGNMGVPQDMAKANNFLGQVNLDVVRHITTWAFPIIMEGVWKWTRRKPNITGSLQL